MTNGVEPFERITVLGAGAWGTALANTARNAGREVRLWGRDAEIVAEIGQNCRNPGYLGDVPLAPGIIASTDVAQGLADTQAVLIVTPSRVLREICAMIREDLPPGLPLVLCAKGIERDTGLLLSEVVAQELPGHPVGALSGPTFARELALGSPTAATIAFPFDVQDRLEPQRSAAARLAVSLGASALRPYISDDLVGVEVGGAVKNVVAIACGMMTGAGFAENTRAALIVRGMDEMTSLALALGGRAETMAGLAGAGDLTLTCSSMTSRNMSLGVQLGQGTPRAGCFDGRAVVVEGEVNAPSVVSLAKRAGVTMPICEAVNAILHHSADLRETFAAIWSRPIRAEARGLDIRLANPMAPAVGRGGQTGLP